MTLVNRATGEISCKLVYYGPSGAGKSRNLRYVFDELPPGRRGEGAAIEGSVERPLLFEFLPLELGPIASFHTRLQLYAAPAAEFFGATRKHVLQSVDGMIFIVDSRREAMADNIASLKRLHLDLAETGLDPAGTPMVFQYNKRDLAERELLPLDELDDALNFRSSPAFSASAITGTGVFQTLRGAAELVLRNAARSG
ncbi:GTPase domain-containing protein [soil metagenome]